MRNRFDTLKFAIPAEAVRGIRQAAFNEKTDCDLETGQVRTWLKAKPSALPIGFAELTNERNHPDWTLSLSAKALGDSYLQGIGLENIEEALSGIGQILDLNLYKALDSNPQVYRADTSSNIPLTTIGTQSQSQIMEALNMAKRNPKFKTQVFNRSKNIGITFKGNQEEKNYIKAYDKFLDLNCRKNQDFLKSLNHPARMLEQSKTICRIESEHTTFRSFRNRFKTEPRLLDILDSKAKVNHDFLAKVIGTEGQLKLFDEILQSKQAKQSPKQFIRELGLREFAKSCDYNIQQIEEAFRLLYPVRQDFHYNWNGARKEGKAYGGVKVEFQAIIEANQGTKPNHHTFQTESNLIVQNIMQALAA